MVPLLGLDKVKAMPINRLVYGVPFGWSGGGL